MSVKSIPKKRLQGFIETSYWYHIIELPDGRVTKGTYDLRPFLSKYGFPESLEGKTVLDVGASDGFFSFEFERRGANVFAVDTHAYNGRLGIDPSPFARDEYIKKYAKLTGGNRLLKVKGMTGSKVKFRYLSVYDLESLGRKFDIVFCGDLIGHLKNPLMALENLRSATKELCVIAISNALPSARLGAKTRKLAGGVIRMLGLKGDFVETSDVVLYAGYKSGGSFFHFSPSAFRDALLASGFRKVVTHSEFDIKNIRTNRLNHHIVFHCYP